MTVLQTLGPIQIIDCGFGHIAEVEMLIEDEVNLDQSKSHLPSLATKVGYSMEEVPDVEFHSDLGNTRYHRCGDWKCIAPTIILTSLTPWIRHSKLAQKKFTEVRDFFFGLRRTCIICRHILWRLLEMIFFYLRIHIEIEKKRVCIVRIIFEKCDCCLYLFFHRKL